MENTNKIVTLANFSLEEKRKMLEQLQSELENNGDSIEDSEVAGYSITTGTITVNDVLKNSGKLELGKNDTDDTEEIKYDDVINIENDGYIDPLPIHVTKNNTLLFTLYYNPVNPAIFLYLDEIQRLVKIKTKDKSEIIPIIKKINEFIDAIFGEGAANTIHRHDNVSRTVLMSVFDKLRQGYEEYSKTMENAEAIPQSAKIIEAKKQAAQFRPPVNRR